MIQMRDLTCGYLKGLVLEPLNCDIETGSVLFLFGANGAGKSTILKTIAGALPSLKGSLEVGKPIFLPAGVDSHESLLGQDVIELFEEGHRSPNQNRMIEDFQINDLLFKPLREMSSGERQRVFLSAALTANAKTFLLDEPTSFLDLRFLAILKKWILSLSAGGKTFLIATHDHQWALGFDHASAWLFNQGRLQTAGPTEGVILHESFENSFGVKTEILKGMAIEGKALLTEAPKEISNP